MGKIDILTGGFPCQPFSLAGKRKGTEDSRHLWPEMLRAVREIRPRWVVGENVFGIVNWDGGLVFEQVQADLENEGYEVQPFVLPAAGIGAPHKRDRVWFVAHAIGSDDSGASGRYESEGTEERVQKRHEVRESGKPSYVRGDVAHTKGQQSERGKPEQREFSQQEQREFGGSSSEVGDRNASNTNDTGLQRIQIKGSSGGDGEGREKQPSRFICPDWENFPTESPVRGGNDGFSPELAGITVPKHRNESIKAYGNAIVPGVALQIFKAIELYAAPTDG